MLEPQVTSVINDMIKEYRWAAKVMFYHFRIILCGPLPLDMARDNPADLQTKLKLDGLGSTYLQRLASLLDDNRTYATHKSSGSHHGDNRDMMQGGEIAEGLDGFDGAPNGIWIRELFRTLSSEKQ
jgi:hypothetical protein